MQKAISHTAGSSAGSWISGFSGRSGAGFVLLAIAVVALSYITVFIDYKWSGGAVAVLATLLVSAACIVYPVTGFYITIIISVFIFMPERLVPGFIFPTGLIPEFFSYLVFIGVLAKPSLRKEIDEKFWFSTLVIWFFVLLVYFALQAFNPYLMNKLAWFNFFRKYFSYAIFLMIAYCVMNSTERFRQFNYFWIGICAVEALYACKQHWFGLFNFEMQWLISDQNRMNLYINWGLIRKWGLTSDPAASGILYAASAVYLLILAIRTASRKLKLLLYPLSVICMLASTYTGTRTSILMIIAGVIFYSILTMYEKRTILVAGGFAFLLALIIAAPIYDNVVVNRVRSTFDGSKDPSAQFRDMNRKGVQPFVHSHPFGGGPLTSGNLGQLNNPGHYLNNFSPDSGFMQVMMELGYVGLILTLIFYFVVLRTGIRNFYISRDPEIRTLYLANLIFIFTMYVSQFSQMSMLMYPTNLYYLVALVLFIKLYRYDQTIPHNA